MITRLNPFSSANLTLENCQKLCHNNDAITQFHRECRDESSLAFLITQPHLAFKPSLFTAPSQFNLTQSIEGHNQQVSDSIEKEPNSCALLDT
jgi:hypothetical protein